MKSGRRAHKKQTGDNMPPGRNEPCDCGSKRKWKKCCGATPVPDRYAAYEDMDDAPQMSMAMGPYSEDATPVAREDIYMNMNGRLVRVVDAGLDRVGSMDCYVTRLMEDMWTGRIFKPEDSNDVYIAATFDCEMEILALMARGPLDDE